MKKLKKQLDVDFIGGEASLTTAEEKIISDFIKKQKTVPSKPTRKYRLVNKEKNKA